MWGSEETGAMEEYYSESNSALYTEPKLIDFFKCETPLRKDHGELLGEQTYAEKQELGSEGNGGSQELSAIADGGRSLKLEPPCGNFVDFLGGNGDDPKVAVSRSSSDDAGKQPMVPKLIQEAVTGDQWSLIMARRSLPNLILNLLSPSPTGTQGSGTSPPKTPTFDMELNSRTRSAQPYVTSIPDHEGESSTFSADSDRRRVLPDVVGRNPLKLQFNGNVGSRVHRWSPKNGLKRLRIRPPHHDDDPDDEAAMVEGSKVELSRTQKDEEVEEAVVQAAASLLSLSSNEDDWKRTALRRSVSSSAVAGEGSMKGTRIGNGIGNGNGDGNGDGNGKVISSSSSLAVVGEGSERESGESGSFVRCSSSGSVLSRPSNKRRYRLMVDLLAESPRVR